MSHIKVFIHTNESQLLGAKVAAYSFRKLSGGKVSADLIELKDHPVLTSKEGRTYLRKGRKATWINSDLQSFSPLRFLPPQLMDYKGIAIVTDPDVFAVSADIAKLGELFDFNQKPLTDGALDLFAGAAVDPQSQSWSGLQSRFEKKIVAGAQFFQSQLITDFEILEKFMDKIAVGYNKPILAGIFLLKSAKNAQFINKAVPGVNIPEHIIERLAKAKHPLEEGMKIAAEQVQIARGLCQGVHLMAVKREDLIAPILDLAGVEKVS
jgi:methylenetetrahydrofolate reductase (NADPH)